MVGARGALWGQVTVRVGKEGSPQEVLQSKVGEEDRSTGLWGEGGLIKKSE